MNRTYAYPAQIKRDQDGRFLVRFRDLPEALTDGATLEEAFAEALDALAEAVMGRILDEEQIPLASQARRGDREIMLDPEIALKAALCETKHHARGRTAEDR